MSTNAIVLRDEVINVLKGVLIHQRQRWSVLLQHRRQHEAWWKAEFAMALESWAWSADGGTGTNAIKNGITGEYGVFTEEHLVGLKGRADLVVAPWPYVAPGTPAQGGKDSRVEPSVWIEIKTRGTWWGDAGKGLGPANQGLLHDFEKSKGAVTHDGFPKGDTFLLCHLLSDEAADDGNVDKSVLAQWTDVLDKQECIKHETFRAVCPALLRPPGKPTKDEKRFPGQLSLRLDIYQIR